MTGPTPSEFIAALRKTRDPNWSDMQHLLDLVWAGDVIARPEGDRAAENALGNIRHACEGWEEGE